MFVVRLAPTSRTLLANVACFIFLIIYTLVGGFVFLYLEGEHYLEVRANLASERLDCIEHLLDLNALNPSDGDGDLASTIASECLAELELDARREWNLKNSLLFGFGILTTLGYGKI